MPRINRPLLDDSPGRGHRFYWIEDNGDGTVDVFLSPVVCKYSTDLGVSEYDISVRVVRGVEPWPELEDDIRARYNAWCDSGEVINL